jgi:hypothetical protein
MKRKAEGDGGSDGRGAAAETTAKRTKPSADPSTQGEDAIRISSSALANEESDAESSEAELGLYFHTSRCPI